MELVEFLRARLAEDEAAAKAWLPIGNPDAAQREHIARHDPGRVLWEVEAKRRILAKVRDDLEHDDDVDDIQRLLALPYADHPDYDESWKP